MNFWIYLKKWKKLFHILEGRLHKIKDLNSVVRSKNHICASLDWSVKCQRRSFRGFIFRPSFLVQNQSWKLENKSFFFFIYIYISFLLFFLFPLLFFLSFLSTLFSFPFFSTKITEGIIKELDFKTAKISLLLSFLLSLSSFFFSSSFPWFLLLFFPSFLHSFSFLFSTFFLFSLGFFCFFRFLLLLDPKQTSRSSFLNQIPLDRTSSHTLLLLHIFLS